MNNETINHACWYSVRLRRTGFVLSLGVLQAHMSPTWHRTWNPSVMLEFFNLESRILNGILETTLSDAACWANCFMALAGSFCVIIFPATSLKSMLDGFSGRLVQAAPSRKDSNGSSSIWLVA